jgi:hypothetical protein
LTDEQRRSCESSKREKDREERKLESGNLCMLALAIRGEVGRGVGMSSILSD